jgi:soluble lytic murein transglycosylase-like protein
MSNHDDALGSALWLVAGGAAGYAATRWLVAPHLGKLTAPAKAIASSSSAVAAAQPTPRALAAGPSGDMRPIDPYSEPVSAPNMIVTTPTRTTIAPPSAAPTRTPTTIDGPITMPSQLEISMPASSVAAPTETRPATAPGAPTILPIVQFATSPRVRRFDAVFERYRGSIPIEYVRALVQRESNGQPSVRAGSAIGLMQIVPVVLDDYNKRHGTAYRSEHLINPATNVAIGCELLRIIIKSYRKNHPRVRTLQEDWNNPQFIELLTFGWNAGFSEAGGVGRVARYLEGVGAVDITIDQVAAHAKLAGASKHLSNTAKVAWCKSVVALYLRERAAARAIGTELASALTT